MTAELAQQDVRRGAWSPAGVANHWAVRASIYGLLAFPAIDYFLRQYIHPLGLIWDKLILLVLAVCAAMRYLAGFRVTIFSWQRVAGLYILFLLALMFAGLNQPLISVQGFRIDVYYMLYAFLVPFVIDPRDVQRLLHFAVSMAILVAVSGVYQYITRAPIPHGWINPGEHVRTRVYSVLISPNELGSYMALMLPITAGLFLYEQQRLRKWLYGFGVLVSLATLLFTFTRGAWLALFLALVVVALLIERRLLILLVAGVAVAYFLPPIHHRIAELVSPIYWMQATKEGGRIAKWLAAFDVMGSNPLFGGGLGRFGGAVSTLYQGGIYSDNYYAKTLGESGLIGLSLLFAMHIAIARDLWRTTVKQMARRQRYVFVGAFTGILAVIFHNALENVFEFAPMALAYFLLVMMFLIWGRAMESNSASD